MPITLNHTIVPARDKQAAARQLGVSVRTLYNRLKEYECSTRDPTPG